MSADGPTVRMAAIQPNLPRAAHRDTQTPAAARLTTLATQTWEAAAQGAQLLAVPSLFGRSIATATSAQVVFRAIEHCAAVVLADVAFNSAIVDPYGRIVEPAITPEGAAATLVADAPLGAGDTPYARLGDWLG